MTRKFLLLSCVIAPLQMLAGSPYINKVYEFRPAPGQFVNKLPEYEEGDTYDTMLEKAQEALAFDKQPGAVSLGAFGGYVVFGFDHTIVNVEGTCDFKIYGNAIISDRNNQGGSCEPGVVWVSRDDNGNGLPDDTWYEIAGSEAENPRTVTDFSVTYHAPAPGDQLTPDPDNKHITNTTYLPWSASDGTSGYIEANDYNALPYWPEWVADRELTFTGTRLPDNALDMYGDGSYILLKMFEWGYADNCPNSKFEGFDISWAVDKEGLPVALSGIDFVKVVTGLHQRCGALGESSTEVCGAEDLHPDALSVKSVAVSKCLRAAVSGGNLHVFNPAGTDVVATLYNLDGTPVARFILSPGHSSHNLSLASGGIYLLTAPGMRAVKLQVR